MKKFDNVSGALAVGTATFGGSLWLLSPSGFKAHFADERQAAAALFAFFISLILAGFPAGWLAGRSFSETPLPVWLAMAGAYFVPAVAWFAGLEPTWPACLAWAWALPFAGTWAGLCFAALFKCLLKKKNTTNRT